MIYLYSIMVLIGLVLGLWTGIVHPEGLTANPWDTPTRWVSNGPFKYLKHPMYVGTWLMVTGCAGLAAGIFNALAVGTVTEMLLKEWAHREAK